VQVEAEAVTQLLSWAKSKNIALDKISLVEDVAGNRPTVVAAKDLSTGEAILTVPQNTWVTPEAAQKSAAGQLIASLEPWLQVALLLLLEKSNAHSSNRQYLDSLPSSLDTPMFWSDKELGLLEGTQLLQNLHAYKQFFKQQFQLLDAELFAPNRQVFPESSFTLSNFTWAVALVRSRIHAPLDGSSSSGQLALVPVADLVQHRSQANSSWKVKSGGLFGSGGLQLVVEATQAIHKGETVSLNYGPDKLDNTILLDYGVLDSVNPQPGYSLSLSIPEDDRWYDDKVDVLERNGLAASSAFNLLPGQPPSEEMMGFMRLMQLSGADVFLLEAIFEAQAWEYMCFPVSKPNEAAVCSSLIEGAKAALAGYPTTIDEDIALLRSGKLVAGSREEMAVKLRLGEKEALDGVMGFFEGRQAELNDLEYYQERRLRRLKLIDDQGRTTYDSFFNDGIA